MNDERRRLLQAIELLGLGARQLCDELHHLARRNEALVFQPPEHVWARHPDVLLERHDGSSVVRPNLDHPRSLSLVNDDVTDDDLAAARWVIRSVHQRSRTLVRIFEAILEWNSAFLDRGPEWIVRMPVGELAARLPFHMSTLLRACQKKYVDTPYGVIPMDRFVTRVG